MREHMKPLVYADNAATTKLDKDAFEAMVPWLTDEYGNASQSYSFSIKPKKALAEARETIAKCINALPEEIYFTSGGTESNNWAIKGSAFSDPDKRVMITSTIEHHAVLHACESIERLGYPVVYLVSDKFGVITPESLEEIITDRTRLVSIMFSNNEIGTIEPIKRLVEVAHRFGSLFHTDAVQAVGHIVIDVDDLGVDMLSASAHKFNGPKGVGFLYIRNGVDLPPLNDGGAQEGGRRAGTENVAAIVGMATALKKNCDGLAESKRHIQNLENILINELGDLHYIRNGSDNRVPGNISISFKNHDGEAILHRLDLMGICISTGSACDSVNTQISHVLKAIQLDDSFAKGTIRISLGNNNSEEDVHAISTALKKILLP